MAPLREVRPLSHRATTPNPDKNHPRPPCAGVSLLRTDAPQAMSQNVVQR